MEFVITIPRLNLLNRVVILTIRIISISSKFKRDIEEIFVSNYMQSDVTSLIIYFIFRMQRVKE